MKTIEEILKKFDEKAKEYGAGGFKVGCYECDEGMDKEEIKSFIAKEFKKAIRPFLRFRNNLITEEMSERFEEVINNLGLSEPKEGKL